jgi:hypothetical protein
MMRTRIASLVVLISLTALGCDAGSQGFGGADAACIRATECPDAAVPSYQADIAPILKRACFACHGPGGVAGYDESTYLDVYDQRSPILSQVSGCQMPPASGPDGMAVVPLTTAERVALTGWLECGAPDN